MSAPRIILALGPVPAEAGAIVLDFRNRCFWRDGVRRPRACGRGQFVGIFSVLAPLIVASPHVVPHVDLYEVLFGDRADGGPDDPGRLVRASLLCDAGLDLARWLGGAPFVRHGIGYSFEFGCIRHRRRRPAKAPRRHIFTPTEIRAGLHRGRGADVLRDEIAEGVL